MTAAEAALAQGAKHFVRSLRHVINWDTHGVAVISPTAPKEHREAICAGAMVTPDGAALAIVPICVFGEVGIPLDGKGLVMCTGHDKSIVFAVPFETDAQAEEIGRRLLGGRS